MLPDILVRARARIGEGLGGLERLRRKYRETGQAADEAAGASDRFDASANRVARTSSPFARGIQNASFQLGDFATQVGAGTSASIALGQQLPQLLGGFGILGAVLGAVVAIAVPLTRAFQGMGEQGTELTGIFGTLTPAIERIGDAFRQAAQIGVQAAELIINNVDRIITITLTAAAVFGGRYVASMVAARVATLSLAGSLAFLRAAIIRTGFGALIVGAGELVYQFTRLVQAAGSFGEAFSLVQQVAKEAFQNIDVLAQALGDGLSATALWITAQFLKGFDAIRSGFADMVDAMLSSPILEAMGIDLGKMAADGIRKGGFQEEIAKLEGQAGGLFGQSAAGFNQALPSLEKMRGLLRSMKEEKITIPDILGVGGGGEEDEDGEGGGGKGEKSAAEKLDEELTAQEERIKDHFDRIKALTEGGLSDKLGAWNNYFSHLVQLTGTQNEKLLSIAKAFKASQALVDAWSAYNQVLADPSFVGRPWARAAAAANVLAAGIGAYNAIRSVGSNGSGQTSASGSGGGSTTTDAGSTAGGASGEAGGARNSVLLQLNGEIFGRAQVRDLINRINEEVESGATIRVV